MKRHNPVLPQGRFVLSNSSVLVTPKEHNMALVFLLAALLLLTSSSALASSNTYAVGTRQTTLVTGKRYFIYDAHYDRYFLLHGAADGLSTPFVAQPADFVTTDEGYLWELEESGTEGWYLLRNVATGTYFSFGALRAKGNRLRFYNASESGCNISEDLDIILANGSTGSWKGRNDIWAVKENNGASDGKVWWNANNNNGAPQSRFTYWTNSHPFAFYDVRATTLAEKVQTDILPWVQSVGKLFGLTPEAFEKMHWDDSLTQSCSSERYEELLAIVNDPLSIYCPSGYYRLTSSRGGALYLYDGTPRTETQNGSTTARRDYASSVVRLERLSDGGFYIGMQDLYLQSPMKDAQVAADTIPVRFMAQVQPQTGKVAFTTGISDYSVLHCGKSRVIGYTLDDEASYWTVEEATSIAVEGLVPNADRSLRYGTLYVPFPVTADDPVSLFSLREQDGTAVAHPLPASVPPATPMLLTSTGTKATLSITNDCEDVDVSHEPILVEGIARNAIADSSFYYYNKAFLVSRGTSEDGTTYYRTDLSTAHWIYFWQQALVILMVEDRYDFRGDTTLVPFIEQLLDAFCKHETYTDPNSSNPFSARAVQEGISDWAWNHYNDDLLWAGLAFIRGYRITGQERFLKQAQWAWDYLYGRGWDDALGGGIWWNIEKESKSSLSNDPAICMACYLYDATGEERYLQAAKDIYKWVYTYLRNANGAIAEHITPEGEKGAAYNVYTQGTFIEGAAALYRITGDTQYRTAALASLDYVTVNKTVNGILSQWGETGTWQSEFARGVAFLIATDHSLWSRKAKGRTGHTLYSWLRMNADVAWSTREPIHNITCCEWAKATPSVPRLGETWQSCACVSAVVMTQVVPEEMPTDEPAANSATAAPMRTAAAPDGLLRGTYHSFSSKAISVLRKGSDGMEFYGNPATARTAKANSAYVDGDVSLPLDMTTSVSAPVVSPRTEGWYDLQGRRLQQAPQQPGIYIHNGRKILIR